MKLVLLSPPATNELTGGHLYNRYIRCEHRRVAATELLSELKQVKADAVLLDSLYLPVFRSDVCPAPVFFLLHAVPADFRADGISGVVVPSARIDVGLPRVVCAPGLDDRYRSAPALGALPPRVLTVANVQKAKGVFELLDAFLHAQRAVPGWQWHLIGDLTVEAETTAQLRRDLEASGLTERVVLHGLRSPAEVFDALGEASVFALLSHSETYGMALNEAVARGLPCVVTNVGEASAWVHQDETGFVCSVDGAAEALTHLMHDDELRARMRKRAFDTRPAFRGWDEVSKELLAGLESLLSR